MRKLLVSNIMSLDGFSETTDRRPKTKVFASGVVVLYYQEP